jgi:pimeloyl-ACP methyl ester carboxylesterase
VKQSSNRGRRFRRARTGISLVVLATLFSSLLSQQVHAATEDTKPTDQKARGEHPPEASPARTKLSREGLDAASATMSANGTAAYRVDSGFDLDQYLYRESSPLDFSIDIPDSFGPVDSEGHPAPGNALYGKNVLLTMRVYDVDQADGEVDHLSVNGAVLPGELSGVDEQWAIDTFRFSTALLRLPTSSNPQGRNDFAVDIDVTQAGWAVQVDWAELRPADTSSAIPPAVFVHGIIGNNGPAGESKMADFKNFYAGQIPQLAGRAIAPRMTQHGSIQENAGILAQRIDDLTATEIDKRVDLIAHSMGGLASRQYAWDHIGRVRSIMMVATPNGGSRLANILCGNRKIPWWARSNASVALELATLNWGPCNGPDDGLYQLQEDYVQDVFNKQVPDLPSTITKYATIAGQGNAALNILLDGEDDGAVSVNSVRYLARDHPSHPGQHLSLLPAYEKNHEDLIKPGSPAYQPSLCWVYGSTVPACLASSPSSTAAATAQKSTANAAVAAATSAEYQPAGGIAEDVPAGATRTYNLPVPEGATATLLIGTDDQNELDTSLTGTTLEQANLFEVPALAGKFTGPQTLTVRNTGASTHAILTFLQVASTRKLTSSSPPLATPGDSIALAAAITEPAAGDSPQWQITDEDGTAVASGSYTPGADAGAWQATLTAPPVGSYTITSWVEGAEPRVATRTLQVADAATVGNGFAERVEDPDGDGLGDRLILDVPIDVRTSGAYRLAGRLVDADGNPVAEGGGSGEVSAGNGTIPLLFDGRELHDRKLPGPWRLVDVALSTDGSPARLVDLKADLGVTTAADPASFEHLVVTVGESFTDEGVDTGGDARFESLRVSGTIEVETPGEYAVNAELVAPDGTEVARAQDVRSLSGTSPLVLDFAGLTINAAGKDGPYTVTNLSVYPVSDPNAGTTVVDAHTTSAYEVAQFTSADQPPQASFTYTTDGRSVSLDASGSSDDVGITDYAWDFGDGNTGSGASTSHTYGASGTYDVTLTVTDTTQQTASTTQQILIAAADPPDAPATVTATPGNMRATVQWTPPTDDGGSPITGYEVIATPGALSATVPATARSHQFTGLRNGTAYTLAVRALNAAGAGQPRSASARPHLPVADYDGDGKAEIAVFRPSTSKWLIGKAAPVQYGKRGDVPVPADYNGNGKTDIAVFRPSEGNWYIRGIGKFHLGQLGDIPLHG